MELRETVTLMVSPDYIDRFKAEYYQTKIRKEKLEKLIKSYSGKKLDFEPKCSINLLRKQKDAMKNYLGILKIRADIESIDLGETE